MVLEGEHGVLLLLLLSGFCKESQVGLAELFAYIIYCVISMHLMSKEGTLNNK